MNNRESFLVNAVEQHKQMILDAERWLWKHPEVGFTEWESHKYLKEKFEELGYEVTEAGNIPGFFTDIDTGKPGPFFCIMAELDALDIANHPESVNGMCHSCGHHAQGAALLGVAAAFKEPGALDGLSGKIRLMMVPAEELIQVGFREDLRKKGIIHFFGGKPEFMYRGFLDGIDLAMMVHASEGSDKYDFTANGANLGCIAKRFVFKGVASHAAEPSKGVNAEYASMLGLNACNALRETFPDADCIRFHPINHGVSSAVNIIPNEIECESYVRATTLEGIKRENEKINRALTGAALSMGARLELHDRPGYTPEIRYAPFLQIAEECCKAIAGDERVLFRYKNVGKGSSDMGDISAVMPSIQFYSRGCAGACHGTNFVVADPWRLCGNAAKAQVLIADAILSNGGEKAYEVMASYKPRFNSIPEYLEYMSKLTLDKEAVTYNEDGSVVIDFKN